MNKAIPGRFSILFLILIASIFSGLFLIKSNSTETEIASLNKTTIKAKNKAETNCKVRTFQGEAKIKVFQEVENNESLVRVLEEDLNKLPSKEKSILKIVDSPEEIKGKLAGTTKKDPMEIKITGFAIPCNSEIALASLDYKDKIFQPYIKSN